MISKRGYVLLGLLAAVSAALLVLEHFNAKDGTVAYTELVEVHEVPPIGGFTIVRDDPERLLPVIRAQIAGSPSVVRLGETARDFAMAEGLKLLIPTAPGASAMIAEIAIGPDAILTISPADGDGKARLALLVRDKAMGEVPALRPVFDRLVAKVREALPDNAIEEVD